MRRFIRKLFNALLPDDKARRAMRHSTRYFRPALERLEERAMLSAAPVPALAYVQTNLVSNIQGQALITDQKLVDPWGINFPQLPGINPPVVVADQGTGVATSYQISPDGLQISESSAPVKIPTDGSSEPSGPTGVVQNTDPQGFLIPGPDGPVSATYIFDTLQGTIEGYAGGINSAQILPNASSTGAEYTGLAAGVVNGQDYIYAANEGTTPGIQVINDSWVPQTLPGDGLNPNPNFTGNFTDTSLPAGFMPYGVRDLSLGAGSKQEAALFVTYRSPNFQGGVVAVFSNSGTFLGQIDSDTTGGNLQSPWGLAYIQQFGDVGGDLLVGNFSSGQIDAYQVNLTQTTAKGTFLGPLLNANGATLTIPGLRTIHFGPGLFYGAGPGDALGPQAGLLFTADNGNVSLYGEITPPANVNLGTGMATGTGGISNIQQVSGSGQGDVPVGNGSGVLLVETAGKNLIIGGPDRGAMLDSGSGQDIVTGLTGGISNIQNVTGSKGNDNLVGDANPQVLIGGTGRNLIIGGKGADTLTGGPAGHIPIRDRTDYDANIAALDAIMAEWDSGDNYAMRYSFITAPAG